MGEAADDAIDRGMEEWLSGEYADDPYYSHTFKDLPKLRRVHSPVGPILGGKWRLFDATGKLHICASKTAKKAFK